MTTHRHYLDRPCTEIGPTVCLQRSGDGAIWVNFDPADEAGLRGMGRVEFGQGQWTETGSLAGGDLTIKPSIRISDHQGELLHGFVRAGRWVPA